LGAALTAVLATNSIPKQQASLLNFISQLLL
jgi:hypothetical protein